VQVLVADHAPAALAVEAEVDGDLFHPDAELHVSTQSLVRLRMLSQGQAVAAQWTLDGNPAGTAQLSGAFVRAGSYKVVAARDGEGEVALTVVAADDGG
jgi:hypothetical protein